MSEVLHKGDEVVLMNGQYGVIEDFFFVKRNQYAVISLGNNIFIQQVQKCYHVQTGKRKLQKEFNTVRT